MSIGSQVRFVSTSTPRGDDIPLPHADIFETVAEGDLILIDDGRIRLRTTEVSTTAIVAEALINATLQDRKGVNFPDTKLAVKSITPKDTDDLRFALELGVDWVAMSFVQTAQDIEDLRVLMDTHVKIIAKIEKPIASVILMKSCAKQTRSWSHGVTLASNATGMSYQQFKAHWWPKRAPWANPLSSQLKC